MNGPPTTPADSTTFRWLHTGEEGLAAMTAAIEAARETVRLETYTFSSGPPAERICRALAAARRRGVRVRILADALGSRELPAACLAPVVAAGGEFRRFNPLALERLSYRDHRKVLVCDERRAIVGGFNIAPEYDGDGVTRGWRDLGLEVAGSLAADLAAAFDRMFARADFRHPRLQHLRRAPPDPHTAQHNWRLLLSGPGRRPSQIRRSLNHDVVAARSVQIVAAYFLPPWPLRRRLLRVARRGGRVQLLLAGRSDVTLSQLAGRRLYGRFLRAGAEIYEYQPQVLHAKLSIVDDAVYVGSSNLDMRSLQINYELMVRVADPALVAGARGLFARMLAVSRRIEPGTWLQSRTFWDRLKERWAYWVLARLDPLLARWQWKRLR